MGGLPGCTALHTIALVRGHHDSTDRAPDAIDVDRWVGEPFIDLAARLAPPDPSSIRARLTRRPSTGLRERLARSPLVAPIR